MNEARQRCAIVARRLMVVCLVLASAGVGFGNVTFLILAAELWGAVAGAMLVRIDIENQLHERQLP